MPQKGFGVIILIALLAFSSAAIAGGFYLLKQKVPDINLKVANLLSINKQPKAQSTLNQDQVSKKDEFQCLDYSEVKKQHKVEASDGGLILAEDGKIGPKEIKNIDFLVDDISPIQILGLTKQKLDANLKDPKGNVIDSSQQSDQGFVYTILIPTKGKWTLNLSGSISPNNEYKINAQYLPIRALSATSSFSPFSSMDKLDYKPGDIPHLCVYLFDGNKPIVGAQVSADLILPDNSLQKNIKLSDELLSQKNDGIYAIDFKNLTQEGSYFYQIKIIGNRADNQLFSRVTISSFKMLSSSVGKFNKAITSSTVDQNNDGLFDELVLEGTFEAKKAGLYYYEGGLLSQDGESIGNATSERLNAKNSQIGTNKWTLSFSGRSIQGSKKDGPYKLGWLELSFKENEKGDYKDVDRLDNSFISPKYSYNLFQRSPLELGKDFKEDVVDTNGDGKYNILRITVSIDVVTPETYLYQADLSSDQPSQAEIQTANMYGPIIALGKVSLKSGMNNLIFDFNGSEINSYKYNGPYKIASIIVSHPTNGAIRAELNSNRDKTYTTKKYTYDQFDAIGNLNTGTSKLITSVSPLGFGGMVTLPISGADYGRYSNNTTITLTAEPNQGKTFVRWTENNITISTDNPLIFKLNKDRNIVAEFK